MRRATASATPRSGQDLTNGVRPKDGAVRTLAAGNGGTSAVGLAQMAWTQRVSLTDEVGFRTHLFPGSLARLLPRADDDRSSPGEHLQPLQQRPVRSIRIFHGGVGIRIHLRNRIGEDLRFDLLQFRSLAELPPVSKRIAQIYAVNLAMFLLLLVCAWTGFLKGNPFGDEDHLLFSNPLRALLRGIFLLYWPGLSRHPADVRGLPALRGATSCSRARRLAMVRSRGQHPRLVRCPAK